MHTNLKRIPRLAEYLNVPIQRAYYLARLKGYFPPGVIIRIGRQVRWNEEKLREFFEGGGSLGIQEGQGESLSLLTHRDANVGLPEGRQR